ncbi:MAG TPA: valine--tRNA ligase, partial [Acidimicrobiia bacterium]|nr:valine--tRNA ligase [Acidimicrobiia bacterium]
RLLRLVVVPADEAQQATLRSVEREIVALAGLDALEFEAERPAQPREQRMVAAGAEVVIPFEGLVDVDAARDQLDKQIAGLESDLAKVDAKLANEQFVANAPPEVVEKERRRAAELGDGLAALRGQRALLD